MKHIAVVAVLHFAMARESLLAGKHVFVEKPLSLTHEDGCALVVGNPSREIGWVCACGERLPDDLRCPTCDKEYRRHKGTLVEKRP